MQLPSYLFKTVIFDSLLHVFILFVILSLIFWLLIRKVSTNNIQHELNNTIRESLHNIDPQTKEVIISYVNENKPILQKAIEYYKHESSSTERNNKTILSVNIVIIMLLLFTIMIVFGAIYFSCANRDMTVAIMKHAWLENIIIFSCLASIEVIMFLSVVLKYSPIMPSDISNILTNELNTIKDQY